MGTPQTFLPTSIEDWAASDKYHNKFLIQPNPALEHCLKTSEEANLPAIAVSAALGKFLNLFLRSIQAKRVLEVGTLGGYSAIWMASALPEGGELISLEISQANAELARKNIAHAGLDSKVKVIVGPAVETLTTLDGDVPFDLAFIDADKESNTEYFQHAQRLVKPGGIIIVDNVVRYGRVANPEHTSSQVEGVRRLLRYIESDKSVDATTIATAGEKGYDGFLYAINNRA